nr:putative reverse transcriptase domain-containing protein [Tanacetum cinerariifolium]
MDLMNRVCMSYLDKFVIMFIDDILIYLKSKEDHELHEAHFLGHVVYDNDIHVNPSKIKVVKNWKVLKLPSKILTKLAHYLAILEDYKMDKLARLYIDEIVTEIEKSQLIGPEMVYETTDKVVQINERHKPARDRQKSYADNRRKPSEFSVGDHVLLKVSPWKGVVRFSKKGKLAPRYVGPFEIIERIGHVAYRLGLPQELSIVHDTFHVSNLKKCLLKNLLKL